MAPSKWFFILFPLVPASLEPSPGEMTSRRHAPTDMNTRSDFLWEQERIALMQLRLRGLESLIMPDILFPAHALAVMLFLG